MGPDRSHVLLVAALFISVAVCQPVNPYFPNQCSSGEQDCCNPGYEYNVTSDMCSPCSSGFFKATNSSDPCSACQVGQYSNVENTQCLACPNAVEPDSVPGNGIGSCFGCPVGSILLEIGNCQPCQPGSYAEGGTSCVVCPAGTYSEDPGNGIESCQVCQRAQYSPPGATECTACPPGEYSNSQRTQCVNCPNGSYFNTTLMECVACAINLVSNSRVGTDKCHPCNTTKGETPNLWNDYCEPCSPGSVPNEEGISCIPCEPGSFANSGFASCELCAPGTYARDSKSQSCKLCNIGFFAPDPGASACLPSDPGNFVMLQGAVNASQCEPGKFSSSSASSSCSEAEAGFFVDSQDMTRQTPCKPGTYSTESGRDQCDDCPFGQTSGGGQTSCATHPGIIAAASIGGFLVLCAVVLALAWFIKQKAKTRAQFKELEEEIKALANVTQITDIERKKKIGAGHFGEVYLGKWMNNTMVALKCGGSFLDFQKELSIIQKLSHPNIVQFYGIWLHEVPHLVMEYLNRGSLAELLRNSGAMGADKLLLMCMQACSGMTYLSQQNVIHRDLACRNLLVHQTEQEFVVKVSDFGMSKATAEYYKSKDKEGEVPVRWMAPEALEKRLFTVKSDVWSFAITMWEIFTMGIVPYPSLNNEQVYQEICNGKRLDKPAACPDELYAVWLKCWNSVPAKRPDFSVIFQELKKCSSIIESDESDESDASDESGDGSASFGYSRSPLEVSPKVLRTFKDMELDDYMLSPDRKGSAPKKPTKQDDGYVFHK